MMSEAVGGSWSEEPGAKASIIRRGTRTFVDVSDVVAGLIAAAERGRAGERYILGGHDLTHRQAITTIAQVVGAPVPRVELPQALIRPLALAVDLFNRVWPGTPPLDGDQVRLMKHSLYYNNSKARRELGLAEPVPFQTSVEYTFRWYKDNGYL